ncbi:MAG: hypothetical protein NUW07_10300 [Candidatus Saccharicenans sp.]|jgi:hypothetical protein|nr:hypothetical protein [Candidatus Saccharicenans sp.]MDH7493662.1 hypothetical protein [Candidatus Saccharicenans sp.]
MKKYFGLVVIMGLAVFLMVSCGGKKESDKTENAAPAAVAETQVKVEEKTEATPAGGDWRGLPIYPGAKLTEKISVSLPVTEELKDLEYRYFTTGDEVSRVADFYQKEIPKRGWVGSFMTSGDFAMGNYQKDEGKLVGVVFLDKIEGKTTIMLATGTRN